MFARPRLLVGLGCCVVMLAAAACQALPGRGTAPTAGAQPTVVVSTTASATNDVLWAKVPYCGCVDGLVTDNVTAALKKAQLAGTVKLLNPTNGWMYFVVAFNPQTASRAQITAAITAGGGQVLAGPP